MGTSMEVIRTEQLTRVYPGGVTAVDAIDFQVDEGEIFGFLGPNGAGKTTTIKMLNTLLKPTSGTAIVAGFDVVKDPDQVRRNIGYVAQDVGVDENATGRENLELYAHFYRLGGKAIKERVRELLQLVDLTEYAGKLVYTYSGGMRKRLDIAMGLIQRPKLIFLDEPTTGLDPQTRVHIWDYIRSLAREMGITIFLTTHYMEEADHLAHRGALIDRGKLVATGTPGELKQSVGGDVVTLTAVGTSEGEKQDFLKQAQEALSGRTFVLRTQATDGQLAVYVDRGETAAPALMGLLAERGIQIGTLSISRPTLDDVFLKYTGRTIRAEEGRATTYVQMHRRRDRRASR